MCVRACVRLRLRACVRACPPAISHAIQILRTRLRARVARASWEQDVDAHHGNGAAGFVPPCVKAREIKQLLTAHAEALLLRTMRDPSGAVGAVMVLVLVLVPVLCCC